MVWETMMEQRGAEAIFGAVVFAGFVAAGTATASAQTFQSYRCTDGTRFLAAFYQYDSRAFLQIDGGAVTLARSLNWSGTRYSGDGITLTITKAGIAVKHARRPTTACEVDVKQP
jgi:membrane-bound inhibitor of C-type lysozyme